ncbi:ROK family protein [Sinomonas sp. R1AF57]|uniref:ROK family protein n=1 Tax=Sinomonas sp. R1AF57 TaxID=2020377 RepID=UPI000B61F8F7|nr:ROK family protein [Sinomonas sp. R1AF57]ASN50852.1 MarR family transcriptional regulator [Sinomonas sp. R1AF57]
MTSEATPAPGRVGDVRRRNLALVLGCLGPDAVASRAEIAAVSGLTKASVSSLVADLLETGLLEEVGVTRGGERGRPGVGLALNPRRGALGAEVNVDYLAVGVLDLRGQLRVHETVEASNQGRAPGDVLADLHGLAARVRDAASADGVELLGGGLAVPGIVDATSGRVATAPNLGWDDVPLADALEDLVPGTPFAAELSNEADSAALAELWYGRGRALGSYLYLSGEVGVGGGLVIGSQLFTGAGGHAGEVGHVVVDPGGRRCSCGGRGCVETVAGQEAILGAAGITGGGSTTTGRLAALTRSLDAGDDRAIRAVKRAGEALAVAVVAAARLVDLSAVVLGGHFGLLRDVLGPALDETLDDLAPGRIAAVTFSDLGASAAVTGAAGAAVRRALAAPHALLG